MGAVPLVDVCCSRQYIIPILSLPVRAPVLSGFRNSPCQDMFRGVCGVLDQKLVEETGGRKGKKAVGA